MRILRNTTPANPRWIAAGFGLGLILFVVSASYRSAAAPRAPGPLPLGDMLLLPALMQDATGGIANVVGANACGECHAAEFEAWKNSSHFATWRTMHRLPRAKEIADKLELAGGIKRNDLCYNCHYTATLKDGEPSPTSGVSCESCHGPAKEWVDVHNDYGEGLTIDGETPDHRAVRLEQCDAKGMIRRDRVYLIAANCYNCHSVPNEKLVNVGGHIAGSDFDLIAWSQGEVRHNYFYTDDGTNRPATAERMRMLYVIGVLVDLEYALRGAAIITEKGPFRTAMFGRVHSATAKLDAILAVVSLPDIESVIASAPRNYKGRLKLSRTLLQELPERLSEAARQFAETHDGSLLVAVDALLPDESTYHGTAQP